MLTSVTTWWNDKIKPVYADELIEFYCDPRLLDVIPHPVPAFKNLPDWVKAMKNHTHEGRDHFGGPGMTAKKCSPMMDAMMAGYHILLAGDVHVTVDERGMSIVANPNPGLGELVQFHSKDQAGGKTSPSFPGDVPKFINPWVIKTRKGYSCRIDAPVNRFDPRFTCLSAIVDTDSDRYTKQINFPAIWHQKEFAGIIKAGTPLVTVTPFRRNDLPRYAPVRAMTEKEREYIETVERRQNSRLGVYTDELREPRKGSEKE